MEYIIVAFRSRTDTIRMADYLRSNGVMCEVISTPKEAGVGCGLSVKTIKNQFGIVNRAVKTSGLSSFAGYFLVENRGFKRTVRTF